jgi:hypothetical protein
MPVTIASCTPLEAARVASQYLLGAAGIIMNLASFAIRSKTPLEFWQLGKSVTCSEPFIALHICVRCSSLYISVLHDGTTIS